MRWWVFAFVIGAATARPIRLLRCSPPKSQMGRFMGVSRRLKLDLWGHGPGRSIEFNSPRPAAFPRSWRCTAVRPAREVGESAKPAGWFEQYHRYDEIVSKLRELAKAHPKHVRLQEQIGKSHQGRAIPAVVIADDLSDDTPRQRVFVSGGQHAREWASPATVMHFAHRLAAHYAGEQLGESDQLEGDQQGALRQTEFHLVPLVNPDGYEYSFTNDRYWRKNRRNNEDGTFGVDLNRNWPNHWGGSAPTDAEDYPGPAEASEPEVQAVTKYLKEKLGSSAVGLDYHSYGSLILRSPGWRRGVTKDEPMLKRLGAAMAKSTRKAGGGSYKSEPAAELYPCTGALDDYMSEQVGMWGHGWTVELPGDGHQFKLPEGKIRETAEGAYKGMVGFITQLQKEKLRRSSLRESDSIKASDPQMANLDAGLIDPTH